MADFSDLVTATKAVVDPSTSAADLAAIAQLQPTLRPQVAAHPNVYPGLLAWLDSNGDVATKQAVATRPGAGRQTMVVSASAAAPSDRAYMSIGVRWLFFISGVFAAGWGILTGGHMIFGGFFSNVELQNVVELDMGIPRILLWLLAIGVGIFVCVASVAVRFERSALNLFSAGYAVVCILYVIEIHRFYWGSSVVLMGVVGAMAAALLGILINFQLAKVAQLVIRVVAIFLLVGQFALVFAVIDQFNVGQIEFQGSGWGGSQLVEYYTLGTLSVQVLAGLFILVSLARRSSWRHPRDRVL